MDLYPTFTPPLSSLVSMLEEFSVNVGTRDVHGIGDPNEHGNPMGMGQEYSIKRGNGNGDQPGR